MYGLSFVKNHYIDIFTYKQTKNMLYTYNTFKINVSAKIFRLFLIFIICCVLYIKIIKFIPLLEINIFKNNIYTISNRMSIKKGIYLIDRFPYSLPIS